MEKVTLFRAIVQTNRIRIISRSCDLVKNRVVPFEHGNERSDVRGYFIRTNPLFYSSIDKPRFDEFF
jgi:hypothetical protein